MRRRCDARFHHSTVNHDCHRCRSTACILPLVNTSVSVVYSQGDTDPKVTPDVYAKTHDMYPPPRSSRDLWFHGQPTEVSAALGSTATEGDKQRDGDERTSGGAIAAASEETAAAKQMSTVVDLMRQQIEWSMRSESGRREQDLGSAAALEARMRTMEVRKNRICRISPRRNSLAPNGRITW